MKNETKEQKLDDILIELDPLYESVDELQIGRMLDEYGIPFFYKQPIVIYNQSRNEIWKPAFTLPGYAGFVIDYVPNSAQNPKDEITRREQVYQHNQIPAVVFGPEDMSKPNWQKDLYTKLKQLYRDVVDQPGCLTTSNARS